MRIKIEALLWKLGLIENNDVNENTFKCLPDVINLVNDIFLENDQETIKQFMIALFYESEEDNYGI